ncbi:MULTISPECIES: class I SAM-dependent methyltransferase [Rhizobium]|uniref:class I SAM-dependent methyltransferase n=1 Tax=Rhizobium TaxID=379 RepID=UPI00131A1147|nr:MULTISPECIES: class I SAM-dependent methyltransferase [Rhizobium]
MTVGTRSLEGVPDARETAYIAAMSRAKIVSAYAQWGTTSEAEDFAIDRYLPDDARVLDLGCGAGRMVDVFGDRFGSYSGVDGSPEMIAAARSKHPACEFEVADIAGLTIAPASVDAVLLMHNVIDSLCPFARRGIVLEMARASLSPRGILVCSSHLLHSGMSSGYIVEDYHGVEVSNYRSTASEFCAEVEKAGFNVVFLMKDKRGSQADWMYIVGTPRS